MVSIEVCVGSACHVKGSPLVIQKLQALIRQNCLEEVVLVKAAFCFGHCAEAVSVHFEGDDTVYSVAPNDEAVELFYQTKILPRL